MLCRTEPSELAAGLESNDVKLKVSTMKKIILLMLNGEQLQTLLMKVIQFVVPNEVTFPAAFPKTVLHITSNPTPIADATRCFVSRRWK